MTRPAHHRMLVPVVAGILAVSAAEAGDPEPLIDGSPTAITGRVVTPAQDGIFAYPVIIARPEDWKADLGGIVAFTDGTGTFRIEGLAVGEYLAIPGTAPDEAIPFFIAAPEQAGMQRQQQWLFRSTATQEAGVISETPIETFVISPGPLSN